MKVKELQDKIKYLSVDDEVDFHSLLPENDKWKIYCLIQKSILDKFEEQAKNNQKISIMKIDSLPYGALPLYWKNEDESTVNQTEEDKSFCICGHHYASHVWYEYSDESCKSCVCSKYNRKE